MEPSAPNVVPPSQPSCGPAQYLATATLSPLGKRSQDGTLWSQDLVSSPVSPELLSFSQKAVSSVLPGPATVRWGLPGRARKRSTEIGPDAVFCSSRGWVCYFPSLRTVHFRVQSGTQSRLSL